MGAVTMDRAWAAMQDAEQDLKHALRRFRLALRALNGRVAQPLKG